jgi:hypothetical protein
MAATHDIMLYPLLEVTIPCACVYTHKHDLHHHRRRRRRRGTIEERAN